MEDQMNALEEKEALMPSSMEDQMEGLAISVEPITVEKEEENLQK